MTTVRFMSRVSLTKADLMDQDWPRCLARQPGAIISTWALHDLGSQQAVADVYARCYGTLPKGGLLVNGDFIKPCGTSGTYERGVSKLTGILSFFVARALPNQPRSLILSREIENPTAAQNYACLVAVR